MKTEYKIRTTRLTICPENEPIFSEMATNITIVDEAAGEYIEIEQQSCNGETKRQTIAVGPDEWEVIKKAVETLIPTLRS